MTEKYSMFALDQAGERIEEDVSFDQNNQCRLTLYSLPMSQGVYFELMQHSEREKNKKSVLRAEIVCSSGQELSIILSKNQNHIKLEYVMSAAGHIVYLPLDTEPEYNPPLVYRNSCEQLEILFLIDATTLVSDQRSFKAKAEKSKYLFDGQNSEERKPYIDLLLNLGGKLIEASDTARFSILAFGDDPQFAGGAAGNLKPSYRFCFPTEDSPYTFSSWDRDKVKNQLKSIESTTGGDFVDALADALRLAQEFDWSPKSETRRRLVIVFGDSPGFSILNPPPFTEGASANAMRRIYDVDIEVQKLHNMGVELMTIWKSEMNEDEFAKADRMQLRSYTKKQYKSIASSDEYALVTKDLDESTVDNVQFPREGVLIGRGICLGTMCTR